MVERRKYMKTIKQIADELGVSKQAIQKRIKRQPLYTRLYPCIHLIGNTKYIDETGELLLQSEFSTTKSTTVSIDMSIDKIDNQSGTFFDGIIPLLQHNLEVLQKQLETKDKQIEELNLRLSESNSALVIAQQTAQAAQALHAGTIQKAIESGSKEEVDPERPRLFQRLFNKKH